MLFLKKPFDLLLNSEISNNVKPWQQSANASEKEIKTMVEEKTMEFEKELKNQEQLSQYEKEIWDEKFKNNKS